MGLCIGGSALGGTGGGLLWSAHGWPGVAALVAALLLVTLLAAFRLARLPPKAG